MSGRFRGNLKPAHSGYLYQDLITAYVLAESLVHRYESITVDKKVVEDDRIDDLEIVHAGHRERIQIKSSQDNSRRLQIRDFTNQNSSLRIDRLIRTHLDAGDEKADEYRLCATWKIPDEEDLLSFLEPATISSTVKEYCSQKYRFRTDKIWPDKGKPLWTWLENAGFEQKDFRAFCDRFFIELELPFSSNTLYQPGPLETALIDILIERVGIGRYPNHYRQPQDAAAVLLAVAHLARAEASTLTPVDVEVQLNLRTDYGRVSQEFPFNEQVFQDRSNLRPSLIGVALQGQNQIVTGPPGSGKSWELTKLASELKDCGAIVARHYCYLEPGDQLVERRISSDVFFGNLLAEIIDIEPSLREGLTRRYSAGPDELEEVLVLQPHFNYVEL